MSLRVHLVTWNVHGTTPAPRVVPRMRAIAGELGRRDPDLILLQEVWTPVQADLVASRLPGYQRVEPPLGGPFGRTAGLLVLVARRSGWRVARTRFEPYRSHAPAWKLWEGDGLARKGLLELEVERDGVRLIVVNTHLQAAYAPGGYSEIRGAQLAQLRETLSGVPGGVPVLVGGDLNVRPDEPIWSEIGSGYDDVVGPYREQCDCGTGVGHAGEDGGGDWIDYVLVRRDPAWSARARVGRIVSTRRDYPYSDHHGLDVQLTLDPSPAAHLDPDTRRALLGPSTRRAWLGALLALGRRWLV
jgi:endonuclease/exonuclease/phosphatase family metal-dependent hydrolase